MTTSRDLSRIGFAIAAVLTAPAQAQQRASPATQEDIVVTAQKRLESAQDVPVSIVAITGDELRGTGQMDWLDGRLRLNAAVFPYPHTDPQVTTFFNHLTLISHAAKAEVAKQAAYTLVDARIGWTSGSGSFEVAACGKNVTDEEYFHNIVQFTSSSLPPSATAPTPPDAAVTDPFAVGHALGYPAPGATRGLEVNYRF